MRIHRRAFARCLLFLMFVLCISSDGRRISAQDDSRIHVNVVLVQLNVAVTDRNGNYISGLKPEDFIISEDKIPEKIATFEEGNEPTRQLISGAPSKDAASTERSANSPATGPSTGLSSPEITGAKVFVLFDTSNYMYRGFVFAQDAISDFIRQLADANQLAFYSYSRNLSRAVSLTPDRAQLLRGVRSTVAGDDAALYNSLLLTVKDAAGITGKKAIVVFSNGPDNASLVPPEDVAELAQSTGTIIYMVSTRAAESDPTSTAVFERMSKATGGKAYFSKSWGDEARAFSSIREDLAHLYSLSYYPQPNPNRGWRTISVRLSGDRLQKYHVRTRDGYRLQQAQVSTNTSSPGANTSAEQSMQR